MLGDQVGHPEWHHPTTIFYVILERKFLNGLIPTMIYLYSFLNSLIRIINFL